MSGWCDYTCYSYYPNSYILRGSVKSKLALSILLLGCTVGVLGPVISSADSGFTWSPSQAKQHLRRNNALYEGQAQGMELGARQDPAIKCRVCSQTDLEVTAGDSMAHQLGDLGMHLFEPRFSHL